MLDECSFVVSMPYYAITSDSGGVYVCLFLSSREKYVNLRVASHCQLIGRFTSGLPYAVVGLGGGDWIKVKRSNRPMSNLS